ncbi:TlpA family protein disulfide reductase [SAR202 cluster bacterium AC-409-J13_OGT_754m]|nr:TlpA family protein disulfide reductase [SAR202 cluster bacterium AC-409-J13_OGT_754m]
MRIGNISLSSRSLLLVIASIPTFLIFGLLIWASTEDANPNSQVGVNNNLGERAVTTLIPTTFSLTTIDGMIIDSQSLHGHVVMLDFWSSWCAPCRAEAPTLSKVYKHYSTEPVQFVGVSIWDIEADVKNFHEQFDISYPVSIDQNGKLAVEYGIKGIPEKLFIDQEGNLVRKFVGPMDEPTLISIIDSLLTTEDIEK